MVERFPIFDRARRLEKLAGEIADPIERLRFLRCRQGLESRPEMPPPPPMPRRRSVRQWMILTAGLIVVLAFGPVRTGTAETLVKERRLVIPGLGSTSPVAQVQRVWRVESSDFEEQYSNGLRVDLTYAVANRRREAFPLFPLNGGREAAMMLSAPAGIVYHITESHMAPFEEEQNRKLRQAGRSMLEYVRKDRSYHYVIDRFGRVFRIVEESDAANHAGNSVWADARGVFVNLNNSFLSIAFEGRTDASDDVTAAQISSAKTLTEMLRSRYGIAAEDCVTHGQVSVNPQNLRIGAHTDWAGNFPFAALGLPDNYAIPVPAIYIFGFEFDRLFVQATGGHWLGLFRAEEQLARQASSEGTDVRRYRVILQHRFKDIESALKQKSEGGI